MTRTGDREIRSVSGRLPDNPGELACMPCVGPFPSVRLTLTWFILWDRNN